MARSNGHNWLDEAISKTPPGQPPRPDFQAWRKAHAGALATLKRRGQRRLPDSAGGIGYAAKVFRSPVAKLAVAATLVVAVLLLSRHVVNRAPNPLPSNLDVVQQTEPVDAEETVQAVLARADQLCEERDTEGLLVLLETARVEIRTVIVQRLGQSGSRAALPALEQLATRWRGASAESAVQRAIDQIRERAALSAQSTSDDVDANASTVPRDRVVPAGRGPNLVILGRTELRDANAPDGTVAMHEAIKELRFPVEVVTLDEITGAPLVDVLVRAESVDSEGLAVIARTDDKGQCTLAVSQGRRLITAQGWKNGHFESFSRPLRVRPGRTHRVPIRMTGRTKVMGRLIDLGGMPVQGIVQMDGGAPTETDVGGWFAIDEPFGDASKYHVIWAHDPRRQIGAMLAFRMADYTDALVVELAPCAAIVGRAVDSQGSTPYRVKGQLAIATPDGTVFFSSHGQVPWVLDVGSDGDFAFTNVPVGLPLRVSIELTSSGGTQGEARVAQLSAGQTVDIGDVVMHAIDRSNRSIDWTGTLAGAVINENGVPVADARVRAGIFNRPEVLTDSRGRYALTGLAKGARLRLEVYLPDYGAYCDKYIYANSQDGNVQVLLRDRELLGRKAPPLSVSMWLTGEPVALDRLQDTVVLLVVGGLWQLHDQFDLLRSISRKYAERGLEVIVVLYHPDSDYDGAPKAMLRDSLPEQMASIVTGFDDANKTWTAYRIDVAPTVYLIDRRGYIRVSTPMRKLRSQWIEDMLAE